ncbi:hypothetical protein LMI01_15190 [Companilactobacillus mindensis]|nr:hypothetical protein LMI01_15190 [Companilactobacillus mindensis]
MDAVEVTEELVGWVTVELVGAVEVAVELVGCVVVDPVVVFSVVVESDVVSAFTF